MRIVLLGGTDLTLAVAEAIADHVAGVITIEASYTISFSKAPMVNSRFADMTSWAADRGVPCRPWSGAADAQDFFADVSGEWGLAVGWYYLLPGELLDCLPLGVAGVHASLLPKYRGNSPLNWALLNGDTETGVSLFQLTPGLDDGPLYGQAAIPIDERASISQLIDASERAAVRLVEDAVEKLQEGGVVLAEQDGVPTYALARIPADGEIDWRVDAAHIDRLVRATSAPYPGAFSELNGTRISIWAGEPLDEPQVSGAEGQLWRWQGRVVVVTGRGLFAIDAATTPDGADALSLLRKSAQQRFRLRAP